MIPRFAEITVLCEDAGVESEMRVLCPTVVPSPPKIAAPGGFALANVYGERRPRYYEITVNNGDNRGYVHWIVGAGDRRALRERVFNVEDFVRPEPPKLVGRLRLQGQDVRLLRFREGAGFHGGHVTALVRVGPITYWASAHGRHRRMTLTLLADVLAQARK